jgi:hypothetical protein
MRVTELKWVRTVVLAAVGIVAASCSKNAPSPAAKVRQPPPIAPFPVVASWEGPAADAANTADKGPTTPALRQLQGRVPLVHLQRGPWSPAKPYDAAYEVVLFQDGTLVYEGHRCVKMGGLIVTRLSADELTRVRAQLAAGCVGLGASPQEEVCDGGVHTRVTCSNGEQVLTGDDRCRRERDDGKRLHALASNLIAEMQIASWLGEPTERQACDADTGDLAPREISRILTAAR